MMIPITLVDRRRCVAAGRTRHVVRIAHAVVLAVALMLLVINAARAAAAWSSDPDFKQHLLGSVEGLAEALSRGDRLQAANLLQEWVANAITLAISNDMQEETNKKVIGQPAATIATELVYNDGIVRCGAAATFLNETLRLFGLDSFRVDFGDLRDDLTHAVVVLPLRTAAGGWDHYVLDPTFNATFTRDGRQVTLVEALRADPRDLRYDEQPTPRRRFAIWKGNPLLPRNAAELCRSTLAGAAYTCPSAAGHAAYVESTAEWARLLRRNGYDPRFHGVPSLLRARFFVIGPGPDPAAVEDLTAAIKQAGIPIGFPPEAQ